MNPRPTRASLLRDRTDPRAIVAYAATSLLLLLAVQHPLAVCAMAAATWMVACGLLDFREYRPYLLYGGISAVGVMLLNPLVSRAGASVIWQLPAVPALGSLSISAEAIAYGIVGGVRLLGIIGVFAIYGSLVDPDALYRLLAPVSLGSALVTALSIRLMPATARDASRIKDAMRCRGVAFDSGSVPARIGAHRPLVEAVLATSLDRAMSLAESLESRGFGRPGRTQLLAVPLAAHSRAMLVATAALGAAGAIEAARSFGFAYYPRLDTPDVGLDVALSGALFVLALSPLALEWGWDACRSWRLTT